MIKIVKLSQYIAMNYEWRNKKQEALKVDLIGMKPSTFRTEELKNDNNNQTQI